jgi:hypothetical protein
MKSCHRRSLICIFLISNLTFLHSACGDNKFQSDKVAISASKDLQDVKENNSVKSPQPVASTVGISTQDGGVPGGHFDLDTSISTYEFGKGQTEHHVHEYDDKFRTTGVDFFNLKDENFVKPFNQVKGDQTFRIIVGNSSYSPGALLTINGKEMKASEWAKLSSNTTFSFNGVSGTEKLTALSIGFDPTKSIEGQLIATTTDLVRSNAKGPDDSYRAGALTLQIVSSVDGDIDASIGLAKVGSKGMLWEATIFYHNEKSK